jgi:hypothetical protein
MDFMDAIHGQTDGCPEPNSEKGNCPLRSQSLMEFDDIGISHFDQVRIIPKL